VVVVGEGDLARACGVRVAGLPPEGLVIKSAGTNRLVLAGRDDSLAQGEYQQGTAFAVSEFLETQLGVRWLWPGLLGTVLPPRTNITVGPLAMMDAPRQRQRIVRDALVSPRLTDTQKRLVMDAALLRDMQRESRAWLRRQRTGRGVVWNYGPAFTEWWDDYHEPHLMYFAKQLNGSRQWSPLLGDFDRAKICVSNPDVLEQWIDIAKDWFERNPGHLSVSASPNENGLSGHCLCDACEALDATNGPPVQLISVSPSGQRVLFDHPALTDRYVHFYNLAAERLARVAPGKMVGGSAYGAWFTPPVREKVQSNILIAVMAFNHLADSEVGASRRAWEGWSAQTTNLILRPNLHHFGHGFPLNYAHWLGQMLRHCADTGMQGSNWDTLQHHWAAQGLNYYVLAKLLWNPEADVDAIIDDYCRSGFGPAAPAIRRYFDLLESQTIRVRSALPNAQAVFSTNAVTLYGDDITIALVRQLNLARTLVEEDSTIRARIDFLNLALTYTRLQTDVVRAIQLKDWTAARKAIAAKDIFYQAQLHQFAVGVPGLVTEEIRQRNIFEVAERRALAWP
jgi:hypothetical protein